MGEGPALGLVSSSGISRTLVGSQHQGGVPLLVESSLHACLQNVTFEVTLHREVVSRGAGTLETALSKHPIAERGKVIFGELNI